MDISFDKVYQSWTIFYHGKINTLKSKMTGHWGFKKGDKQASFTIEMVQDANTNQSFVSDVPQAQTEVMKEQSKPVLMNIDNELEEEKEKRRKE